MDFHIEDGDGDGLAKSVYKIFGIGGTTFVCGVIAAVTNGSLATVLLAAVIGGLLGAIILGYLLGPDSQSDTAANAKKLQSATSWRRPSLGAKDKAYVAIEKEPCIEMSKTIQYSRLVHVRAKICIYTFIVGTAASLIGTTTGLNLFADSSLVFIAVSAIALLSWVERAKYERRKPC